MTSAQQIESTIFQITINPDPNSSVGPKVGERPPAWSFDKMNLSNGPFSTNNNRWMNDKALAMDINLTV
jgi:hypothetical protein